MFNDFFYCDDIIVLVMYKVLLYGMFKGFKVVGVVCGVVVCKDNNKVGGCSNSGVTGQVGCDRLVLVCGGIGWNRD